ncbi:hypothetical protein NDU88_000847 [Pleurodeles waltl]|uniref:Uncharacterized protein n=1 Tax=Pleurodeles waltl TaxID=8319 RepID=A0AAV7S981_PLEWA|nr:hypothetical protein NDU88_000847 [Pleurodeles waltl]
MERFPGQRQGPTYPTVVFQHLDPVDCVPGLWGENSFNSGFSFQRAHSCYRQTACACPREAPVRSRQLRPAADRLSLSAFCRTYLLHELWLWVQLLEYFATSPASELRHLLQRALPHIQKEAIVMATSKTGSTRV